MSSPNDLPSISWDIDTYVKDILQRMDKSIDTMQWQRIVGETKEQTGEQEKMNWSYWLSAVKEKAHKIKQDASYIDNILKNLDRQREGAMEREINDAFVKYNSDITKQKFVPYPKPHSSSKKKFASIATERVNKYELTISSGKILIAKVWACKIESPVRRRAIRQGEQEAITAPLSLPYNVVMRFYLTWKDALDVEHEPDTENTVRLHDYTELGIYMLNFIAD